MKTILLIILTIPTLAFSQITLHGANISITGAFYTQNDIMGNGEIKVRENASFKANIVSCDIDVVESIGSYSEFFKKCDTELTYRLFDMTGKFLSSGVFNDNIFERYPKGITVIVLLSNNTFKKIVI